MEFTTDQRKWIDFFKKMGQGKIAYNKKFYCIDNSMPEYQDPQHGGALPPIQLVTPTQQQIEQAKLEIKRNAINKAVPAKRRRIYNAKKRATVQRKKKQIIKKVTKKAKSTSRKPKKAPVKKKRKPAKKNSSAKRRTWRKL